MTVKDSGLVALLRKKAVEDLESYLIHYHCVIDQEALVARVLNMNEVMKIVLKCPKSIKKQD